MAIDKSSDSDDLSPMPQGSMQHGDAALPIEGDSGNSAFDYACTSSDEDPAEGIARFNGGTDRHPTPAISNTSPEVDSDNSAFRHSADVDTSNEESNAMVS